MDVSRFVLEGEMQQRAILNLKCAVCDKIVVEAHTCGGNHPFCKSCIFEHVKHNYTCPVDSADLDYHQIKQSTFLDEMLAIFKVRCDNRRTARSRTPHRRDSVCQWVGSMSELHHHQSECPLRRQACQLCGQSVLAIYLQPHMAKCPKRVIACELCNERLATTSLHAHLKQCPEASMYCPNHCVVHPQSADALIIRRKDVDTHLLTCPNRTQRCEFAHVGCTFTGTEAQMKHHVQSDMADHLRHLAKSHATLLAMLHSLGANMPSASTAPSTPPTPFKPADIPTTDTSTVLIKRTEIEKMRNPPHSPSPPERTGVRKAPPTTPARPERTGLQKSPPTTRAQPERTERRSPSPRPATPPQTRSGLRRASNPITARKPALLRKRARSLATIQVDELVTRQTNAKRPRASRMRAHQAPATIWEELDPDIKSSVVQRSVCADPDSPQPDQPPPFINSSDTNERCQGKTVKSEPE